MTTVPTDWWRDAVGYEVYIRSFADGNDDGIGDLAGLTARLDHLAWLGVDVVWITPFYPSPMADFGYDVSDYCDVHPMFGDLATFDRLVVRAHDALAVCLRPAHTRFDGDIAFAVSCGDIDGDVEAMAEAAFGATAAALENAVIAAAE